MSKKKSKKQVVNLVFDHDTTTESGPTQTQAPEINQKYSDELNKALSHISGCKGMGLSFGLSKPVFQETIEEHLDSLKGKSHSKFVLIGMDKELNPWLITEMAKRQFVLNEPDTKYLQIAVRYTSDHSLKDSILVFDRRK